jgi:hypothetical protein
MKIREIITEHDDAAYYAFMERTDEVAVQMMQEYKSGVPTQPWVEIPAARLIKIWKDHAAMGVVRDVKGMAWIVDRMIENTCRLLINTEISGHTEMSFDATLESHGLEGAIEPDEQEKFVDWAIDTPEGGWRISDYGLQPLCGLAIKLLATDDQSEQLMIVDQMLAVTHQRSDLAALFVQGGTTTLERLHDE